MTETLDAYLAAVRERLATDDEQTALILAELRSHMEEKLADLAAQTPDAPRAELERRVVEDFGSPADLAVAYDTEGSMVLRDRKGDILLVLSHDVAAAGRRLGRGVASLSRDAKQRARSFAAGWQSGWEEEDLPTDEAGHDLPDDRFADAADPPPGHAAGYGTARATRKGLRSTKRAGAATGRGAGKAARGVGETFKGIFIGLAIILTGLLLISGVGGIVLFDDIVDLVEANEFEVVALLDHDCYRSACTIERGTGTFFVNEDAKRVTVDLQVFRERDTNGTFWLQVWDPAGNDVFDTTYADSNQTSVRERLSWGPTEGTWGYSYGLDALQGRVGLDVRVRGI